MTTLVEHARTELDLLGEDPQLKANLVAVVGAYASFGHSGGSHDCALHLLERLLRRQPLTPLTADPAEWIDRSGIAGTPLWQSARDGRAMSDDGGRTYTLIDEPGDKVHRSVAPPGWVKALRERDRLSPDDAVAAVWAYLDAGPLTDHDRTMLDRADDHDRTRYLLRRWGRDGAAVASLVYDPPSAPAVDVAR